MHCFLVHLLSFLVITCNELVNFLGKKNVDLDRLGSIAQLGCLTTVDLEKFHNSNNHGNHITISYRIHKNENHHQTSAQGNNLIISGPQRTGNDVSGYRHAP